MVKIFRPVCFIERLFDHVMLSGMSLDYEVLSSCTVLHEVSFLFIVIVSFGEGWPPRYCAFESRSSYMRGSLDYPNSLAL